MDWYEFLEEATATIGSNVRAAELRRELFGHLNLAYDAARERGLDPEAARREALASLGDPGSLARGWEGGSSPRLRLMRLLATLGLAVILITACFRPSALLAVPAAALVLGRFRGPAPGIRLPAARRMRLYGPLLAWASALGAAAGLEPVWAAYVPGIWFDFLLLLFPAAAAALGREAARTPEAGDPAPLVLAPAMAALAGLAAGFLTAGLRPVGPVNADWYTWLPSMPWWTAGWVRKVAAAAALAGFGAAGGRLAGRALPFLWALAG